jgi:hypothetical protein
MKYSLPCIKVDCNQWLAERKKVSWLPELKIDSYSSVHTINTPNVWGCQPSSRKCFVNMQFIKVTVSSCLETH